MRNCFEAVQKRSESICLMRRDKHTNCLMRRDGFRIVFYSYCFRNILVSCETASISSGPYVYVYVCVCVCVCMCMCVRAGVRVRVVVCVWLCMYVSQIVSRLVRTCPIIRTYLSFPTNVINDWNEICCTFIILCIALFQALRTYFWLGSLRESIV